MPFREHSRQGTEIDLLLKLPTQRAPWAIKIKRSLAPKFERGFHLVCDDVRPSRRRVVYGGTERFPIADGVEAVSLVDLCTELAPVSATRVALARLQPG